MNYSAELQFFQAALKNWHINSHVITESDDSHSHPAFDLGLRQIILGDENGNQRFVEAARRLQSNTIYTITDSLLCSYVICLLPDTEEWTVLLIGPFTSVEIGKQQLLPLLEMHAVSPERILQIEHCYEQIPVLFQDGPFYALLGTLGDRIWGKTEHYILVNNEQLIKDQPANRHLEPSPVPASASDLMKTMEDRYDHENKLLHAVSQGLTHRAEALLSTFLMDEFEQHPADPLREYKNHLISINTLMRKAVEAGGVHPYHIEKLSHYFAKQIEQIASRDAVAKLSREMLHKYTLLVRNHSLKAYSLPIQKVITRIDTDLTGDLSLKAHAALLNVNPSYLSSLFKKETGTTLTDYVNQKRIEHGVFLLNSTAMQIQTIAAHCGIPDVNYFTKLFKKHSGKTPKEYRAMIMSYPRS